MTKSKGHMIMLGGNMERHEPQALLEVDDELLNKGWPCIKRSPGGHMIATYLREQGYDVEVIDFWPAWTRIQLLKLFHKRVREDTLVVGISGMFALSHIGQNVDVDQLHEMLQTIATLKERYPQLKFVGGAHNVSAIQAYDLDYYVSGYGEYAIVELFKYFKGEFNTLKIQRKHIGGKVLNVIDCKHDYPAWPMPNARVTYEERDFIQPQEVLTLELARGCKFKCKFCSFPILGVKGDHSRCAESLKEELLDNYNKWGLTTYTVSDETINDNPEKLAKCAEVVKSLPFDVHLAGYVRADLIVNKPETWQDMYDMGLRTHYYGIESFYQPAGKSIGKGINTDKLKEGLLEVQDFFRDKEAGRGDFKCTISLIVGLPYETKETFMAGVDWVLENMPGHSWSITPLYIAGPTTSAMTTSPSEFDRTWKEEGLFREMTDEEMAAIDESDLNPKTAWNAINQVVKSNRLKWSHDTMNLWEAFVLFDELQNNKKLVDNVGASTFYYHRYLTTNKYTIDDLYTKQFSKELSDDTIQPFNQSDLDSHMQFIQDYIEKKLAL